jgi:16S rRNA (guanine(966)-N(2))-methyltransferase RsmD
VGIEALSNGAARAVFVDADRRSLRMIEDNLSHLGLKAQAEVVRADVTGDLRLLKGRVFGVIFLGPPYKDERGLPLALSSSALARVFEAGLAGPETWVILQRHEKEKVDVPPERWQKFRENEYGDTRLDFFRIQGAG